MGSFAVYANVYSLQWFGGTAIDKETTGDPLVQKVDAGMPGNCRRQFSHIDINER